MLISILLFAAVGFTFGYAFGGPIAWIASLGLPIVVALATLAGDGFDDFNALSFVVTLVLTAIGVVLGSMLRQRAESQAHGA